MTENNNMLLVESKIMVSDMSDIIAGAEKNNMCY